MPKLNKQAHARALELHEKLLQSDPEYREAWSKLEAALFTTLADAKLPEDERT